MIIDFPEIERLRNDSNPISHKFPDAPFTDLYHRNIKVTVKVKIPKDEYPSLNFGGNIIGKSGENISKLKSESGCKIMVFGRGSINDRDKVSLS